MYLNIKLIENNKFAFVISFFTFLYLFCIPLYANEEAKEPPKIGNFAVSNTPSPLIGFGQHIIPKNQLQMYLFADDYVGKKKHIADVLPQLAYGMTDDFAITFNVPIAASFKDGKNHSSALEDLYLQTEYVFYSDKTSHYGEQGTLVTSVIFPTGSTQSRPNTGFGATSFFVGATYNRMYTDWYVYTSPGTILTTSHEGTKFGNQFLYQFGVGRNIFSIKSEWTVALLAELTGLYSKKNKIMGTRDPNSGGNVINLTPSVWISSNNLIIQFGVGFPVAQHLNGQQNKNEYLLVSNVGWSF